MEMLVDDSTGHLRRSPNSSAVSSQSRSSANKDCPTASFKLLKDTLDAEELDRLPDPLPELACLSSMLCMIRALLASLKMDMETTKATPSLRFSWTRPF